MKINIISEPDNAIQEVQRLGEILYKIREHTRFWEKYGGYSNRVKMEYWQNKADEWILNHVSIT